MTCWAPGCARLRALLVSTFVLVVCVQLARGQEEGGSPDRLWLSIGEKEAASALEGNALAFGRLNVRHVLRLSRDNLGELLGKLEKEDLARGVVATVTTMSMPLGDGSYHAFHVVETSVLPPDLGQRLRDRIRTFRGWSPSDKRLTLRMEWIEGELRAQVWTPTEVVRLDPVRDSRGLMTVGLGRPAGRPRFSCATPGSEAARAEQPGATPLRIYRLAVACTGEYARFHGTYDEKDKVRALAAIVTTVNRVSGIYEREVAIQFQLVEQSEALVFVDPNTDGLTNSVPGVLIGESQQVIDRVVRPEGYDVGHTLSTGAGGLAVRGCVGQAGIKAMGVTGTSSPIGDPFDVDYVAHELGHQFGANHTFNGNKVNCDAGQRNAETAYEPGSGSTILGYAGICGDDNVQANSDAYFHSASLEEIHALAAQVVPFHAFRTANRAPTVQAPASHHIPHRTPFSLRAVVSDPDGDAVTTCWEQRDLGQTASLGQRRSDGPVFRSFPPTADPVRWFPRLQDLLAGTGSAAERLAEESRTLTFRAVARDNAAPAGAVAWDDTTVHVHSHWSGGFVVTAPLGGAEAAATLAVRWNLAGTQAPPISTTRVRISLSIDDGRTWPHVLAASTDNDGVELVGLPAVSSQRARVRIEPIGNIYFAISQAFRIVAPETSMILIPSDTDLGTSRLEGVIGTMGAREVAWVGPGSKEVAEALADRLELLLLEDEIDTSQVGADLREGVPQARIVVFAAGTEKSFDLRPAGRPEGTKPLPSGVTVVVRSGSVVRVFPLVPLAQIPEEGR